MTGQITSETYETFGVMPNTVWVNVNGLAPNTVWKDVSIGENPARMGEERHLKGETEGTEGNTINTFQPIYIYLSAPLGGITRLLPSAEDTT